jgi:hypothetical protein
MSKEVEETPEYRPFLSFRARKPNFDLESKNQSDMNLLNQSDFKSVDLSEVWNRALMYKSEVERDVHQKMHSKVEFEVSQASPHPLCPSVDIVTELLANKYPNSSRIDKQKMQTKRKRVK